MYTTSTQVSVAAQVALQGMDSTGKTSGSSPTNPGAVLYAVPAPG